jgi:uncharacterized protein YjiS (DUF1127 family)
MEISLKVRADVPYTDTAARPYVPAEVIGFSVRLARRFLAWRRDADTRRALARLDDHMLEDIGLGTRERAELRFPGVIEILADALTARN